jgi:arylsulfatase A-like enzyme
MTDLPARLPSSKPTQGGENLPNIIILVFDALSAHNASLYGYQRETTPNLSRFAERAHVYHNHYAGGNFTSSGTASLLTGTYPWTHRAINLHGTVDEKLVDRNLFNQFADLGYTQIGYSHNLLATSLLYQFRNDIDSFKWTRDLCLADDQLADRFFANDFNAAFWSEWLMMRGGETQPASLFASLLRRFYHYAKKRTLNSEIGEMFPRGIPNLHNLFFVLEDAIDWLFNQLVSLPQPYLMYFHILPPHEPYTTRKDFIDIFSDGWKTKEKPARLFSEGHSQDYLNQNRREYDEYIAYADSEFGRLYDFMLNRGVLENTIVVFTSDHGEMFERGVRGHVTPTLYQPVVQIPLLLSLPGQDHRKDVYTPTNSVDILPTLLFLNGRTCPDWVEGKVLPNFKPVEGNFQREIYCVEAKSNPKLAPLNKATISLVKGNHKLIHYAGYGDDILSYELFDIASDPEELNDLGQSSTGIFEELRFIMQSKLELVNRTYL